MFDSLVETRRTKNTARKAASLPVAVALHGGLILAFLAYSTYAREILPPPTIGVAIFSGVVPPPPIPVTRVALHKEASAPKAVENKPRPIRSNELITPVDIPDRIPVPGPEIASSTGPDNGFLGVTDSELRNNRDGFIDAVGIDDGPQRNIPRAGGDIRIPKLLKQVKPIYPPNAGIMGITGRVVMEIIINERGDVIEAHVVQSSSSIFDESALAAVRQWKFSSPITVSGQAVMVFHTVTINFSMERH